MPKIPVSFEYEGVLFEGYFSNELGAGYDHYCLDLNGVRYGGLIIKKEGWIWAAGPQRMFEEPYMVEFFVKTVEDYLSNQVNIT